MKNPIEYLGNKVYAWKHKNDLDLCHENPILFELKATGSSFKDFYQIVKGKKTLRNKKGLWAALKHDAIMTKFSLQMRFE